MVNITSLFFYIYWNKDKELLELIEARISDIEGLSDDNDDGWESDDGPVDGIISPKANL